MKLPHGWSRARRCSMMRTGVVRGSGAGDGAGRAGGLSELIAGRVSWSGDEGGVGGGEPGREADLDHRGDGRGRGQHRRSGRDPLRWDASGCSAGCMRRPRWASSCASSPMATPCSWPRCCGPIWSTWSERTDLLPGIAERAFIDIDSLLRPVFGHAKQGASYGHTKIAGKQVLRKGLSPLATTISTERRGAGDRRDPAPGRAGRVGQGGGVDGHRGDPDRPSGRRDRRDLGPRRLGLRQQRGGRRLPQGRGPVLAGAGQELLGDPGDRHDSRPRVDPGALPGRGGRPRHRRADQRRRGRRGARVHRVRLHQASGHRPADRAPGP